jgi:hypothetical protein
MPNRVIREGILDSPRYWSVSTEERQLFVHLMLLADDFGLVSWPRSGAPALLSPTRPPQRIDAMIAHLATADLLRPTNRRRPVRIHPQI